jgi:hypothetical protein
LFAPSQAKLATTLRIGETRVAHSSGRKVAANNRAVLSFLCRNSVAFLFFPGFLIASSASDSYE